MPTEKERFEVLLEDIRDSVKAIAEGHQALRSEMHQGFATLAENIKDLTSEFHLYAEATSGRLRRVEEKVALPSP